MICFMNLVLPMFSAVYLCLSQRNASHFRNELHAGQPLRSGSVAEWTLPEARLKRTFDSNSNSMNNSPGQALDMQFISMDIL